MAFTCACICSTIIFRIYNYTQNVAKRKQYDCHYYCIVLKKRTLKRQYKEK